LTLTSDPVSLLSIDKDWALPGYVEIAGTVSNCIAGTDVDGNDLRLDGHVCG